MNSDGERNAERPRSLVGNSRDEHVLALTQSLEFYKFYQEKMLECDRKLKAAISDSTVRAEYQLPALPKIRTKTDVAPDQPSSITRLCSPLLRNHSLDRRKVEFPGLFTMAGW